MKPPPPGYPAGEIVRLERLASGEWLLTTRLEVQYTAKAVILATGTFLKGKIFVGDVSYEGGPDGMFAATELTASLLELGMRLRRFKTGTPARVLRSSIDFSGLEQQDGEDPVVPFSFETFEPLENRLPCHITWTSPETKRVILENLHRSPLYGGKIEGVGPVIVPASRIKSSVLPIRSVIRCLLNPAACKRRRCIFRACPLPCRWMCSCVFCAPFPGWSMSR